MLSERAQILTLSNQRLTDLRHGEVEQGKRIEAGHRTSAEVA
jgi:hypothetical protein